MDESALLAAVRAAPDDDAPRLIYADWLDEQGQGERAEFIRVQCRSADPIMKPCACFTSLGFSAVKYECEGCILRRRERELWHPRNYVNWVPLFLHQGSGVGIASIETAVVIITGTGEGMRTLRFRRGFLHAVTCTAADWLAHGEAILAAQPVCKVHFTDAGLAVTRGESPVAGFLAATVGMAQRFLDGTLAHQVLLGAGMAITGDGIPPAAHYGPSALRSAYRAFRDMDTLRAAIWRRLS